MGYYWFPQTSKTLPRSGRIPRSQFNSTTKKSRHSGEIFADDFVEEPKIINHLKSIGIGASVILSYLVVWIVSFFIMEVFPTIGLVIFITSVLVVPAICIVVYRDLQMKKLDMVP